MKKEFCKLWFNPDISVRSKPSQMSESFNRQNSIHEERNKIHVSGQGAFSRTGNVRKQAYFVLQNWCIVASVERKSRIGWK